MLTRVINNVKTVILLAAIMGLAMALGSLWGTGGLIAGFLFGGVMNLLAYFYSDKLTLAAMRAREVSPEEAPRLHAVVEELSARAGLPKPRVYVSPHSAPNAFATGRSPRHAAVCVTEGLLRLLSPQELSAVLGHELAHVKHYDILISSIAATIAGAISMLAHFAFFFAPYGGDDEGPNPIVFLLTILFAPIAATIIQLAISRSREYAADSRGLRSTATLWIWLRRSRNWNFMPRGCLCRFLNHTQTCLSFSRLQPLPPFRPSSAHTLPPRRGSRNCTVRPACGRKELFPRIPAPDRRTGE